MHMLLWIADAPILDSSTDLQIRSFVDCYQTCRVPDKDDELRTLVMNVQKHTHSKSCPLQDGSCRFSFPHVPVDRTIIARGAMSGPTELLMEHHLASNIMRKVRQLLDIYLQEDAENVLPLTDILKQADVSHEMYEWAVSVTVNRKKLFLQRTHKK